MRARPVQIKVVLILSLSIVARSPAQVEGRTTDNPLSPGLIKGVPFTATWQNSIWDHGELTSQRFSRVARAGDGSTYLATLAKEGLPYEIDIDDLPHNRMITLYPRNQTYRLSTPLGGKFHTLSLEEVDKILEQSQGGDPQGIEGPWNRLSPLGVKQEDGMTLYGQKVEWHIGNEGISELWVSSDLGAKARLNWTYPTEEKVESTILLDIRRAEPDSTLFQIPEGYTEIK